MSLPRFWWTFAEPVSRRDYLRHGAGLVALKYAGDVGLVALATGRLWTPLDYLHSIPLLLSTKLEGAPGWLMRLCAPAKEADGAARVGHQPHRRDAPDPGGSHRLEARRGALKG